MTLASRASWASWKKVFFTSQIASPALNFSTIWLVGHRLTLVTLRWNRNRVYSSVTPTLARASYCEPGLRCREWDSQSSVYSRSSATPVSLLAHVCSIGKVGLLGSCPLGVVGLLGSLPPWGSRTPGVWLIGMSQGTVILHSISGSASMRLRDSTCRQCTMPATAVQYHCMCCTLKCKLSAHIRVCFFRNLVACMFLAIYWFL